MEAVVEKTPAYKKSGSSNRTDDQTASGALRLSKAGGSVAAPSLSSVIVTARVPREIKRKGDEVLKNIGATPTELINAAYGYVLQHGALPYTEPSLADLSGKRRTLTKEQIERMQKRVERTTFDVPQTFWEGKTDDELLAEALGEKYESLA